MLIQQKETPISTNHLTKQKKECAFLVGVAFKQGKPLFPIEDSLSELAQLAQTAGLEVVGEAIQRLDQPNVATYIGSGKVSEIKILASDVNANVILFDDELNPRHQRELERAFGEDMKVLDRTALILDIFALHAHTLEGQLQVELAQLEYRLPLLTRMWTHLARQAGGRAGGSTGGVGLRGPGEKQIESDKREIQRRIKKLQSDLATVQTRRRQQRAKRQQTELRIVALVGYTNAGKSTLLNKLSGADVLTADMLFATLDPTTRTVEIEGGREMLFTDTVGFIQKLPTQIVAAFRATLEEIKEAHVLLHVVDATHPHALSQIETVTDTLAQLEVDELPIVIALNKIDKLTESERHALQDLPLPMPAVAVSAVTGEGIQELFVMLEATMDRYMISLKVHLPYQRGDLLSMFHERGLIESETHDSNGTIILGHLPKRLHPYFVQYELKVTNST